MINKKCIITTKTTKTTFNNSYDIYYIEDYIGFGNIQKARLLTDEIFINSKEFIRRYDYDGYKITWSWYDKVYQFSLKCIEIEKLIDILKEKDYDIIQLIDISTTYSDVIRKYFFDKNIIYPKKRFKILPKIKKFITNTILATFSIISIVYFSIKRKKYTAIWTGDFVYKDTTSDFRLNHLYDKLHNNNIDYVEFIRTRTLKDFFVNTYKRKRFAIYYFSFIYFISLFVNVKLDKPKTFYEAVINEYKNDNIIAFKIIKIIKIILIRCHIKSVIALSFSSRSAHLILAAKTLNIKTIGMMHGLSRKEYLIQEFIECYNENKYIGPDVFGVWSNYLVDYYHLYCKIVHRNSIVHSGLLRPLDNNIFNKEQEFKLIDENKIKVLIISEPLVSAIELLPYLKKLIECKKFEVAIKVRPMIKDSFYEELKTIYPEIINIPKYDGKILEVGKNFDVFIGSHSTAVIEASLINKISILVKTQKWDDYFDINNIIKGKNLLCSNQDRLVEDIIYRIENENRLVTIQKIRKLFFGENKDGVQWIINNIKKE